MACHEESESDADDLDTSGSELGEVRFRFLVFLRF